MVYIKLSEPIKGYDRVSITEMNYFDRAKFGADISISFRYIVYNVMGEMVNVLYDRFVDVNDSVFIKEKLQKENFKNLSAFDSIHRTLLTYLIDTGTEIGTLEVE